MPRRKTYLERALDYNPTVPQALFNSAYCVMRMAMQTHDQSNLPLAGQRLEQALRIAPDDPDILYQHGAMGFFDGQAEGRGNV